MKEFIINEQHITALASYLIKKPYAEVAGFIELLKGLKEISRDVKYVETDAATKKQKK